MVMSLGGICILSPVGWELKVVGGAGTIVSHSILYMQTSDNRHPGNAFPASRFDTKEQPEDSVLTPLAVEGFAQYAG
jgi:hypothetical protein